MKRAALALSLLALGADSAADAKLRRLLSVIDREMREVTRLNKQTRGRDPNLLLRAAELHLEKARLVQEEENERFLNLSPAKRRSVKKSRFFSRSRSHFRAAQKTCQQILSRHKSFKGKGDVYYVMAYNEKEFNRPKKAERYFNLAIRHSPRGSMSRRKSQIALAEVHYNKGRHKKAVRLYESALSKKDRWWTRDAFNLAWSYFKVGQKTKAIGLMKEVERRSGRGNYIDMRNAVKRDLAHFYTHSGMLDQAVSHYRAQGGDVGGNLLKVASKADASGKPTVARSVLEKALAHAGKDKRKRARIQMRLLVLYEKYGDTDRHLALSKELVKLDGQGVLDKDQREQLVYQVKKMAATLQKQVASKRYRHDKALQRKKGMASMAYFGLTARLEKSKSASYLFHSGETLYALGEYDQAVEKYMQALDLANKNKERKLRGLVLNSLLAALGQKGVSQATKDKYLVRTYLYHIKHLPKSKKNEKIAERLFNHYMEKKDVASAEKTLRGYAKRYPKNRSKQEAMVGKIMDHYRKSGDRQNFSVWVAKLRKGEYAVSKKFLARLRQLYLNMEFKKVEMAQAKGDKKTAMEGYLAIFKSESSSKDAKKNAAYNLAVLFRDIGHTEMTYKWTVGSLGLMGPADVKKYSPTFLSLANSLFDAQELSRAAKVHETILDRLCGAGGKGRDQAFANASTILLAENDLAGAKRVVDKGERCRVSKAALEKGRLALLKGLADARKWGAFEALAAKAGAHAGNQPFLIEYLEGYRRALVRNGRIDVAEGVKKRMYDYYQKAKRAKRPIPLESLDVIAGFELEKLERDAAGLAAIKPQFPEKRFNAELKRKLDRLGALRARSAAVMAIGSGTAIVKAYRIQSESFARVIQEVRSFKAPPDKPKEYAEGFKKSMEGLAGTLVPQMNAVNAEAKTQIAKNRILSEESSWFLGRPGRLPFTVRHLPLRVGIVMDKGGRL